MVGESTAGSNGRSESKVLFERYASMELKAKVSNSTSE
jgi:hypothetical protein